MDYYEIISFFILLINPSKNSIKHFKTHLLIKLIKVSKFILI